MGFWLGFFFNISGWIFVLLYRAGPSHRCNWCGGDVYPQYRFCKNCGQNIEDYRLTVDAEQAQQ
jgi:hypothetical protein